MLLSLSSTSPLELKFEGHPIQNGRCTINIKDVEHALPLECEVSCTPESNFHRASTIQSLRSGFVIT